MRRRRSNLPYAQQMLTWSLRAEEHLGQITFGELLADTKTHDAVAKAIEQVGESASKIPQRYQDQFPDIAWRKIIGLRHRLAHDYPRARYRVLYDIVRHDLRPMYPHLERLIRLIEDEES